MITLRKAQDRGYADHGWLKSHHSFSFAGYYDPAHMGWGNLRVINEDYIAAGTGVTHSEFNHAKDQTTHILQIWIEPSSTGIKPGYEQKTIPDAQKRGRLRLIASPDGADDSVSMHADALLYAGLFDAGEAAELALDPARKAYVHLIRGALEVNGQSLIAGDAALMQNESLVRLSRGVDAEVLVFDLAA